MVVAEVIITTDGVARFSAGVEEAGDYFISSRGVLIVVAMILVPMV